MKNDTQLYEANAQWATRPKDERFETLTELRESVHNRRMHSRSVDVDIDQINVEDRDGKLIVNSKVTPCEPSHWSFGQLAQQIGAPAGYLRSLPRPLIAECFAHGLKHAPRREICKFMTVDQDNGSTNLQAVTSQTYGRIWDADVADCVQRIVEKTNGKFYNPKAIVGGAERPSGLYASDHDIFIFMIDGGSRLDVGERAKLNRGFITWNSEVGSRTFGLMTFLFNEVCGNHIIWGAQNVNKTIIRHTSGGPYRFDSMATPALEAYVNESTLPLENAVNAAQQYLLPNNLEELPEWLSGKSKFTSSEIERAVEFAKAEEGDCRTLWQLIQGFTAYARGFDYIDARVNLEKRAGSLLDIVA